MEPHYLGSDCQLSPGFSVTQPECCWETRDPSGPALQSCSCVQSLVITSTVWYLCCRLQCSSCRWHLRAVLVYVCMYPTGELCASGLCRCGLVLESLNTESFECFSVVTSVLICVVMKWAYQSLSFFNDTERNFPCDDAMFPFFFFSFWSELMRNVDVWTLLFFCCDHRWRTILKWEDCCFFARELKAHVIGDQFLIGV